MPQQFPIQLDMYQTVIAFFLPMIIAAINSPAWPKEVKYWISFVVVCLAAAGHLWLAGEFALVDLPGSILKVLSLTIGSYLIFWRPSGITDAIEHKVGTGTGAGTVTGILLLCLLLPLGAVQTGCATKNLHMTSWYDQIGAWTPNQKANFFMETWKAEKATYNAQNAIPNKTKDLIAFLEKKREVLESSRIPIRTYVSMVNAGGMIDPGSEAQIIAWLRDLQLQLMMGGR